jgi:hypothetical protein
MIFVLLFIALFGISKAGLNDNEFAEFEVADEEIQKKAIVDEPIQEVEEPRKLPTKPKVLFV